VSTLETYASLRTRGRPNSLLVDAVGLLGQARGLALDVGAGPLNDAQFMLRAGLRVHAVDHDPRTIALAADVDDPGLSVVQADIRDVAVAAQAYALVVAIHVLPFLSREDLPSVLAGLIGGLAPGGVLCATFLGPDDAWAGRRPRMTFASRAQVSSMFGGLEAVELSERRYDGRNASDEPKRWHVLRCIYRRPG
jgi:trans-aconitate methyltransferase